MQAAESGAEEFIIIHYKDLAGEAGAAVPLF